jgi:hypothetical protein
MEIITFFKFTFMLKQVPAWVAPWHARPTFDKNQAPDFVFFEIEKSTLSNSVCSSGTINSARQHYYSSAIVVQVRVSQ